MVGAAMGYRFRRLNWCVSLERCTRQAKARTVVSQLCCDGDLDGVSYEIDLSTKNAKKLRAALQPWIQAGRRVGGRRRTSIIGASRTPTQPREPATIRLWARKHCYQVASRGRIPTEVVDAFRAAG